MAYIGGNLDFYFKYDEKKCILLSVLYFLTNFKLLKTWGLYL